MGGPVLKRVRQATRDVHQQLDSSLGVMDGMLDLQSYLAIIARLYGFWRGWQPVAAALLQEQVFCMERRRLGLLKADLTALGLSDSEISGLPVCPPPHLRTRAEALGSLYVMEGSALGGKIIQRQVESRLGLTVLSGCAYFNGYGPRTGAMWRSFLTQLEAIGPGNVAAVERGATITFAQIAQWLGVIDATCK